MPSPRIQEPSLIGDGRKPIQDNTLSDAFSLFAPVVEQVGTGIVVNEYEQQAAQATDIGLSLTRQVIANAEAPMPQEAQDGISSYARDVANVRNAVAQGAVGENAARVRINALTREYARRFPAFAGEFTGRNSSLEAGVAQAFEQDAVIAQNKLKAEETSRARNEVIQAGLNPDDPAEVQLWVDIKRETAQNSLITARNARTAAEREQQDTARARTLELGAHATLLETTNRLLQEQKEVLAAGGDTAAWFQARREMFPVMHERLRSDIIGSLSPSPLRDRVLKDLDDTFRRLEGISSAEELSGIQKNLLDLNKSYYERGYFNSLDPETREIFAGLGPDFLRSFNDLAESLLKGSTALDGILGEGGGDVAIARLRDMLKLQPGEQITGRHIRDLEEHTARALDPKAPRTPEAAIAARVQLDARGPTLPAEAATNLYRRVAGTNQEMPLLWWTSRDRLPLAAQVSNTPEFQRRVAKEVTYARTELSRFEEPRLKINEHEDGTEGWVITDNSGRVLMNDRPFFIPSGDGSTPPQQARMPLNDRVRDTINALQILGSEGIQTQDGQKLQDELIRANDSGNSNQRRQ